jgi:hypothetical protein
VRNPSPHFLFVQRTILGCERTPSKADKQYREVIEESAAHDVVLGTV